MDGNSLQELTRLEFFRAPLLSYNFSNDLINNDVICNIAICDNTSLMIMLMILVSTLIVIKYLICSFLNF